MAVLKDADRNPESDMGSLEYATNILRPVIAGIQPQFTYEPRPLQPVNIDMAKLDKRLEATKEKMSLMEDLAIREEFDLTKQATIDESQQFQKKLNALIENVNDLTKDQKPVITVPRTGVVRIEFKIDSRVASFEVSCDTENNCFKGIRCDPPVENFEELVSSEMTLNKLIDIMKRRFRKMFYSANKT